MNYTGDKSVELYCAVSEICALSLRMTEALSVAILRLLEHFRVDDLAVSF